MRLVIAILLVFSVAPGWAADTENEVLEALGAAFGRVFMLSYSCDKMEETLKAAKDIRGSAAVLDFWQDQAKAIGKISLLKDSGKYTLDASGKSDNPVEVTRRRVDRNTVIHIALGKVYAAESVVSPGFVSSLLLRKLHEISELEGAGDDEEKAKLARPNAYRAQAIYLLAAQQAKRSSDRRITDLLKAYNSGSTGDDWTAYMKNSEKQPYQPGSVPDKERDENLADFLGALKAAGYPVYPVASK